MIVTVCPGPASFHWVEFTMAFGQHGVGMTMPLHIVHNSQIFILKIMQGGY